MTSPNVVSEPTNGQHKLNLEYKLEKCVEQARKDINCRLVTGATGSVYAGCKWREKKVAIKKIESKHALSITREKKLLNLKHDNVIKLYATQHDSRFSYFALEFCEASLNQLFEGEKKYDKPMPVKEKVFYQLAKGMAYIHQNKLTHRDVKPQNVLIWRGTTVLMKWADFGSCEEVDSSGENDIISVDFPATDKWTAPEILDIKLKTSTTTERKGNVQNDVFAVGLVYGYYLLNGEHLYGDSPINNLRERKPINWDSIAGHETDKLCAIIKDMLMNDPRDRPSSAEVEQRLADLETFNDENPEPKDKPVDGKKREHCLQSSNGCSESKSWLTWNLLGNKIIMDRTHGLGINRYGSVYGGTIKSTGVRVAVKRVKKKDFANSSDEIGERILNKLQHPNIVKLLKTETNALYEFFALELCTASLHQLFLPVDHRMKYVGPLPYELIVLLQLAQGLEYIHSGSESRSKFVHGDIKPQNVLIFENSRTVTMKWAGFGRSRPILNDQETCTMSRFRNKNTWMAPELLEQFSDASKSGIGSQEANVTLEGDVYSQGLVFGYLLVFLSKGKDSLIPSKTKERTERVIIKQSLEQLSHLAYDIITNMLADEPNNRWTSSKVVQHLQELIQERAIFALCAEPEPNLQAIKSLITEYGCNIKGKDTNGLTPLLCFLKHEKAYNQKDFADIIELISNVSDVNSKDVNDWNALHFLCQDYKSEKLLDIVTDFINKKKIEVNCKTKDDGFNPLDYLLHFNCDDRENLLELVKLLIDNGCNAHNDTHNKVNSSVFGKYCKKTNVKNVVEIQTLFKNLGY